MIRPRAVENLPEEVRFAEVPFGGRTVRLEYARIAPERSQAPLIVFLHEGLGSLALWKEYPRTLCDTLGCRGLVYSRPGYGRSTPRPHHERWPVDFMHMRTADPRSRAVLRATFSGPTVARRSLRTECRRVQHSASPCTVDANWNVVAALDVVARLRGSRASRSVRRYPYVRTNIEMLWFGAFVGFVGLLILWAAVIAPARARKLFARLEAQGWDRVASGDEALRSALEALRPFDLTTYVPDGGRPPEATVLDALARSSPDGTRYLVLLRVSGRDAFGDGVVISSHTVVLELRAVALSASAFYVLARDREARVAPRIDVLGLRRTTSGLDPGFAGLFLVLEEPGSSPVPRLPGPLQQAVLESADLFVYGAGERGRHLPNVSLRVSSSGWAVLVPEPIVTARQLRAFLETADRVSRGLSGS